MKGRCVWSHSRSVFVVLCYRVFVGNADHLAYGRKHVAKDNRSRFLSNQRFAATRSRSRIRCGRNDDCPGYHSSSKDLSVVGLINFKRMRERAKVPSGVDIFPYIRSHYKGEEYEKALQAIEEEEYIAQQNVELQKSDLLQSFPCRCGRACKTTQCEGHQSGSSDSEWQEIDGAYGFAVYGEDRSRLLQRYPAFEAARRSVCSNKQGVGNPV